MPRYWEWLYEVASGRLREELTGKRFERNFPVPMETVKRTIAGPRVERHSSGGGSSSPQHPTAATFTVEFYTCAQSGDGLRVWPDIILWRMKIGTRGLCASRRFIPTCPAMGRGRVHPSERYTWRLSPSGRAADQATSGEIAFVAVGAEEVHSLEADGSGPAEKLFSLRELLGEPVQLSTISASPDGLRFACAAAVGHAPPPEGGPVSRSGVFIVDVAAQSAVCLAGGDGGEQARDPAWAPDGKRVAYVHEGDIHVVAVEGSHTVRLTSTHGIHESCPAWSPDGDRIAFTRCWRLRCRPGGGVHRGVAAQRSPWAVRRGVLDAVRREWPAAADQVRAVCRSRPALVVAYGGTPAPRRLPGASRPLALRRPRPQWPGH